MLCGLRSGAFPQYAETAGLLIRSLANELSLQNSNAELAQGLNRFLVNTVKTLVSAIEAKDTYTSGHSERVNIISMLLGNELDLDLVDLESLYWSALLHDVGKIGLPESILNKPSPLEKDEFAIVQAHPEHGWRMLHSVPELTRAAEGIRYHHERWDGAGYPRGLAGEAIPILARIICFADAFDAIVSNRSYRKGQSPTRAVELIEECVGKQFDPQVVAALRGLLPLLEKHRWVLMSGKKTSFRY
jgi:HD-GYP domain-containing protein (c-di-GMP phosphodiesterase class II)